MQTIRVSATKARNTFFELLDLVARGTSVVVEKDAREIAEIIPRKKSFDREALLQASKASHGILRDYDLKDNPLRRPGAWRSLGKWDRDPVRKKR